MPLPITLRIIGVQRSKHSITTQVVTLPSVLLYHAQSSLSQASNFQRDPAGSLKGARFAYRPGAPSCVPWNLLADLSRHFFTRAAQPRGEFGTGNSGPRARALRSDGPDRARPITPWKNSSRSNPTENNGGA